MIKINLIESYKGLVGDLLKSYRMFPETREIFNYYNINPFKVDAHIIESLDDLKRQMDIKNNKSVHDKLFFYMTKYSGVPFVPRYLKDTNSVFEGIDPRTLRDVTFYQNSFNTYDLYNISYICGYYDLEEVVSDTLSNKNEVIEYLSSLGNKFSFKAEHRGRNTRDAFIQVEKGTIIEDLTSLTLNQIKDLLNDDRFKLSNHSTIYKIDGGIQYTSQRNAVRRDVIDDKGKPLKKWIRLEVIITIKVEE